MSEQPLGAPKGALSGQVITTITNAQGQPAVIVSWFYDDTTRILHNNPTDWTDSAGTLWPAGSGACIADNLTGRAVRVIIMGPDPADPDPNNPTLPQVVLRQVKIPIGGRAFGKATLANASPPDGPYVSADDFNGLSFDLS